MMITENHDIRATEGPHQRECETQSVT